MEQGSSAGIYGLLADALVTVHLAYVLFVIVGQLLILVGALLRWRWIRNLWFRLLHLLAIVIVAFEALAGIVCPLTTWEHELRRKAGQPVDDATFVGRLMHDLLFYEGPQWVFTVCYVAFAVLVLGTLIFVPPRWRKAPKDAGS